MSGTPANAIDRMRGPHDGVLELIIVQPADWESDPFIVKNLRGKVQSYQTFLVSEEFRRMYSGCRGVIVLETSHFPPEEIQQILAKEGVEVRVTQVAAIPDVVEQVRETSAGVVELVLFQRDDWESDPFLVKRLREAGATLKDYLESDAFAQAYPDRQGVIVLETTFAPPSEIRGLLKKLSMDIRAAGVDAAPAAPAATPAPAPAPAPAAPAPAAPSAPAPAAPAAEAAPAAPAKPRFVQSQPVKEDDFDEDAGLDDPYAIDDIAPAQGGGMSPMFFVSLGICALCVVGMIVALMSSSSAPVGPPKVIPAATISGKSLPKESHATVSVRPDRRTFVLIPIQSAKTGKKEYYLLFSTLARRRPLILARPDQTQIVDQIKLVKKPLLDEKVPKPVWKADLRGGALKPQTRSYTGRLERAQRRKHGPVELVLPDNNRNVNKIYKILGIKFPQDSMILVVGEKPRPDSGNSSILLIACLLGALISGGVAFAAKSSGKKGF